MLNALTKKILKIYSDSDYLTQRKAATILYLSLPTSILATFYIIFSIYFERYDWGLIIPASIASVLILLNLVILMRGYYTLASHLLLIILFVSIWSSMFLEKATILQRMDTFILTIALLSITPVVSRDRSRMIIIYYMLNAVLLLTFSFTAGPSIGLSKKDIIEYLIDSGSALLFTGILSYQVFSINNSAIIRLRESERNIEEKNSELFRLNSELNASLNHIAASNEEYMQQNQMLQSAQEDLTQRESTLSGLLRAMPVGLVIVRRRIFTWVNDKFCDIVGYTKDELIGMDAKSLYPDGKDYDFIGELYKDTSSSNKGIQVEAHWIRKGGNRITVSLMGSLNNPDNPDDGFIVTVIDITEKLHTMEALRQSKTMYRLLAENASDMIWSADLELNPTYISPAITNMYGYTPEEVMNKNFIEWAPDELREHFIDIHRQSLTLGNPSYIREIIPQKCKDGSTIWVEINVSMMRDQDQNPVGYVGVTRDVTRRKAAEEAFQREKERLTVTLRSISDGVIATDTDGRVMVMNRAAEEMTGSFFSKAEGCYIDEIYLPRDAETGEKNMSVTWVLKTGETVNTGTKLLILATNGRERRITENCSPLKNADNKTIGTVTVFRDVTERETWERERLKMQQLESLGVLAGGIAHDFNNILSGVMGNISLARMPGISEEERLENIAEAEKAAEQARRLTSQLLTFARGGSPVRENSSMKDILTESVSFALRGSGVKCEYDLDHNLWPGNVDRGQISQVIQNLSLNAIQAMNGTGSMEISLKNVTLSENEISSLPAGRYLKLIFRDTGRGINPEHIDRIFEPYFTTRKEGHGLGLSVVYSIIMRHDGHISVSSSPGTGTCFSIYLPAAQEGHSLQTDERKSSRASHSYRVILMDDEESVRAVGRKMLRSLGCEVFVVRDGEQALEIYDDEVLNGREIDLLILDITVPGAMGGKETIDALRKKYPDVRAIVSSGYSNDRLMSEYRAYGFTGVLAKPYSREELSAAIESAFRR